MGWYVHGEETGAGVYPYRVLYESVNGCISTFTSALTLLDTTNL